MVLRFFKYQIKRGLVKNQDILDIIIAIDSLTYNISKHSDFKKAYNILYTTSLDIIHI